MSAELTMSQQSVVGTGGEQGSVQVTWESPLSQSQFLHLSGRLLVTLLGEQVMSNVNTSTVHVSVYAQVHLLNEY